MTARTKKLARKRKAQPRPTAKEKPELIALRAYARHRGCSVEAVRRAIQSGRLDKSVVMVGGKPKIEDQELADREWETNTREPSGEPTIPPPPEPNADEDALTIKEAQRRKEVELWRLARIKRQADQLDLDEKRGQLISVQEARDDVIDDYTVVRTKLLGLSRRCQQRLPKLTKNDVALIDSWVREALEQLALEDKLDG